MTEKQRRFAEAYARDPNATAAAVAAGYSIRSAYSTGQRLLKNAKVREYLRTLLEPERESSIASAEDVRRFWTQIMNDDGQKTSDRLKASEFIAKAAGLFLADVAITTGTNKESDVIIYLPQLDTLEDEETQEAVT